MADTNNENNNSASKNSTSSSESSAIVGSSVNLESLGNSLNTQSYTEEELEQFIKKFPESGALEQVIQKYRSGDKESLKNIQTQIEFLKEKEKGKKINNAQKHTAATTATTATTAEPGATGGATCSEEKIDMPKNEASNCWWLSVNLALFHRKRKEIEDEFANKQAATTKDVIDTAILFSQIYTFYSNPDSPGKTIDLENERRTSQILKKIFNSEDKQFKIDSTDKQDASEYITKLFSEVFDTIFFTIIPRGEDETKSNIWMLYDIYLQNVTLLEKGIQSRGNTIILYFPRMKYDIVLKGEEQQTNPVLAPFNPLENISLVDNNKLNIYILDSIVCVREGHYYSYVRCGNTKKWLKYGAESKGKMTKSFSTFEALKDDTNEDIKSKATMLFYTISSDLVEV